MLHAARVYIHIAAGSPIGAVGAARGTSFMTRILLLDDEPLILLMLEDWLTELDCVTVGPARTVEAALRLVETSQIDGAILDRTIGNTDSFAVADALIARAVPFAFASGYGAQDLPERFKGAPILAKPFDFSHVENLVANLRSNNA
jgi:CheY-like chemotaxis protein